jgi:hypothetical protein
MICTNMPSLRVQIVRFVDEYQPGIVECQFRDADGQMHSAIGKLPCFQMRTSGPILNILSLARQSVVYLAHL